MTNKEHTDQELIEILEKGLLQPGRYRLWVLKRGNVKTLINGACITLNLELGLYLNCAKCIARTNSPTRTNSPRCLTFKMEERKILKQLLQLKPILIHLINIVEKI